ncbi:hypothetical protein FIBSPDRAFT_951939 [Athelia psychrophila]|uniref:Uncharacterized protein n=1 Tax=Athelia psychrophila TaxID=1759441 RepID=A0A166LX26_9AGAM|nr:hypothetical protein FIBSPDRAFT_951939 [Fibularhizoctonia sp. CBS 109695]
MSGDIATTDDAPETNEERSYVLADLASLNVAGILHILSSEPDKYPHKVGPLSLAYKKKPTRDILSKILLDPANG